MPEVIHISDKPSLLSPEEVDAIRTRSAADAQKLTAALALGINGIVDAKAADTAAEIADLKARVDRLERLLAPCEVMGLGDGL